MATSPLSIAAPPTTTASCATCIVTGIPGIGTVDYSNPLEIGIWAGIVLAILAAPGSWKIIAPLGLLALRLELEKIPL
jgi:hypothetical protein